MPDLAVYYDTRDPSDPPITSGPALWRVAHLFVVGAPDDINLVRRVLRRAGRDPALIQRSPSNIVIASKETWPEEVTAAWNSGQVENLTWEALQNESNQWRRITIRVTPGVYATAQALASRRKQSITEFCVDAIEAQVRTRSRRIEHEIFRCFHSRGYSENKRAFHLPDLHQYVLGAVPNCSWQDIVDALKRLNRSRYIKLDKWTESSDPPFRPYDGNDGEFFYRGQFRIEITPDGGPYFDALKNVFESAANDEEDNA